MLHSVLPSQDDFRHVGGLLVELVEPATSLASPGTAILRNPQRFSQDLRDFTSKTASVNGEDLLTVRAYTVGLRRVSLTRLA